MGFDFSQCGAVTAEGRSPLLTAGVHLVKLADCTFGQSEMPGSSDTVLKATFEIIASSDPTLAPGSRRAVIDSNSGKFGNERLARGAKALAAVLNGMAADDPRINCDKSDTARAQQIGNGIQQAIAAACAHKYDHVQFAIHSEVAIKDGQVKTDKNGAPYHNHRYEVVPVGWRPPVGVAPAQRPVAPQTPAPQQAALSYICSGYQCDL